MDSLLSSATVIAGVTAAIHAFVGGPEVLPPLHRARVDRLVTATHELCWHGVTATLALMAAGLAFAWARGGEAALIVPFAVAALSVLFGGIALVLGVSRFGTPFAMPQWVLFFPLALVCALRAAGVVVRAGDLFAWMSGGILTALAALHVYWGLGGAWPGDARHDKVEIVVGLPKGSRFPSLGLCLLVAFLLLSSAALVLGQRYGRGAPAALLRLGAWAAALVLGARGLGGFFEARLRPATRALPYHRMNRLVYSPLSLALAAMVAGATLD
ncbi:DUF3995 domain-containing protein [Sorangium sp. So ce131]|uniref:DUF3995 domain-containing protein n=1 Tax=Sorangium sp. So ce131 TaxID=3133282 RepID=UPI003F62F6AC